MRERSDGIVRENSRVKNSSYNETIVYILKEECKMTLREFREATKDVDENVELMVDATENPVWYVVKKPRRFSDNAPSLYLMDKSGIDLDSEIDAALKALGEEIAIHYLLRNGVTLEEIKSYSENLYITAKEIVEKQ